MDGLIRNRGPGSGGVRALPQSPDVARRRSSDPSCGAAGAAPAARRRRRAAAPIRPGLRDLVMSWTTTPAFVTSALGDVLAANALATALNPSCTVGTNIMRALFLDERSTRDLYGDPDAAALIGELSIKSETFQRLWPRQDVKVKADGPKRFRHPLVGEFDLRYETFVVSGTDQQRLTVYHAEPASRGADALQLLSALVAAPRPTPADEHENPH